MKLLDRLRRKKKKDTVKGVPESWITEKKDAMKGAVEVNQKTQTVTVRFQKGRKIRVPGLRQMKRFIAAFVLIFNFVVAQGALTSHPDTQPFALFFYLNMFFLLDYLWKTRKKSVEWTPGK